MKTLMLALLGAGAMLATAAPAAAADGCGAGFHRGPRGRCISNRGPVVVRPGGLIVGRYYARRGYWDGRRYWRQRYRHHNGWRYR